MQPTFGPEPVVVASGGRSLATVVDDETLAQFRVVSRLLSAVLSRRTSPVRVPRSRSKLQHVSRLQELKSKAGADDLRPEGHRRVTVLVRYGSGSAVEGCRTRNGGEGSGACGARGAGAARCSLCSPSV